MHESLERLHRLALEWPRVCIGSSGAYSVVGNAAWWGRIEEAMGAVCDDNDQPITKLHGLRMLNTKVFTRLPFASADSTNIARNVGIDVKWKGTYTPPSRVVRAKVLRERIEAFNGATTWNPAIGLV